MIGWHNFFSCNPFVSRSSAYCSIIEIDPCKNVIDTDFTIDFCTRRNPNNRQYSNHSSVDCCRSNSLNSQSGNTVPDCDKNIEIDPCIPCVEETIQANVDDDKLLRINLNLLNVCTNRKLNIGILLCNNGVPYAFKMQTICIKPFYCCRKHRRCFRYASTNIDFDFLLSEKLYQNQVLVKIITQYLC